MVVDVDMKLDLLELLRRGVLPLRLQILLLLILEFAEVHDPDHRRRRAVGDQHEVQPRLLGKLPGAGVRNHIQLFAVNSDQADLLGGECTIIRFQQLSNNSTLPSKRIFSAPDASSGAYLQHSTL